MNFQRRKINLLDNADNINTVSTNRHTESVKSNKPIQPDYSQQRPKQASGKKKKLSWFFVLLIIILMLISSALSNGNNNFLAGVKNSYLVRQITNIISSSGKYLEGEKDDRINFVLMGMGGAGHDGPYLTDTIIIASFKPSTKEAAIFSLPRDMIVPISDNEYRKINAVYTIGQQRGIGGGELVKEVISKTFDMPIHYFAAVDFQGFVEMIDAIGGVEIDVKKNFTDNQFPTADYKVQSVSFTAGQQKMDGLTALRFARSRHGNNGEGSDFARIKRQQQILLAAKDKMTSFNTLINPKKITSLFSLFTKYTSTDLEPWEAVQLIHLAKDMDTQRIITQSIDDGPDGYLKSGISIDGAYILQPTTGSFTQIQHIIKNIFSLQQGTSENAHIVIQNGTDVPGLALKAVNHLAQMGYNVLRYGNAPSQDKISTVIYDYTKDKTGTKKSLEAIFQTNTQDDIPLAYLNSVVTTDWGIRDENGELEQLDFLIIIGRDQITDDSLEIVTTVDPSIFNTSTATSTEEVSNE